MIKKYLIAESYASAIINNNYEGLYDSEVKAIQAFLGLFPGFNVSCSDDSQFAMCNISGLKANCLEFTFSKNIVTRYINRRSKNEVETVDELTNEQFYTLAAFNKELKRLVNEYNLSDPGGYYYISNRSTKEWRNS